MESLKLSFSAVTPIFLLMMLGYFLKRINLADKRIFDGINKLIFKVFLPTLLFYNIYKTETLDIFDLDLIIFAILGIMAVFAVGFAVVFLITKDNSKRGVMLQGFFRSNFAILGIPLTTYICGENSGALVSLMVAIVVPVFNVFAVICLETFKGGRINLKKIIKGVLINPLIIGCLLGVLFLLLKFKLPSVLEKTMADVSKIASPLALIVLGASFSFSSLKGYLKENIITVSTRLIIVPLIMLPIAALVGFRGEAFVCLMLAFGSPVAVSSFTMAQQMGGDEKLAGQLVVLSSAFCILTLFMWIFIFSYWGVI